jgi:tetratricopeptide (TPR) repeat protein
MADEAGLEVPIGVTEQRFMQQLARIEARALKAAQASEQAFMRSNKGIEAGFKSAGDSADVFTRELERLQAKFNPLYAASRRYEASLDELNLAHRMGVVNAAQYEKALERLNADLLAPARSADTTTRALMGMSNAARTQLQNVGYQVQDVAVQISSGTDAARALSQQFPQMLSGFGAVGVVLGTVAAIAIPLAASFLDLGEDSGTLSERLDELRDAVDAYRSAAENAAIPTADLEEKYGTAAEAAQKFLDVLSEIENSNARSSLDRTMQDLASSFGGFDAVARTPVQMMQGWTELSRTIDAMTASLGVTEETAMSLVSAFQRLGEAEGAKAQADAAEALLAALEAALGPSAEMNSEAQTLYDLIAKAGVEAADMQGAAGRHRRRGGRGRAAGRRAGAGGQQRHQPRGAGPVRRAAGADRVRIQGRSDRPRGRPGGRAVRYAGGGAGRSRRSDGSERSSSRPRWRPRSIARS